MNVVILKYNAGNIHSVVGAMNRLGITPNVTDDIDTIRSADKILFPGQGEAATTMQYLKAKNLDKVICDLKQPVLGICIGMQLMCQHSEESNTDCLGIFDGIDVKRFNATKQEYKIPHMGWNTLTDLKSDLYNDMNNGCYAYFIHSFYVPCNKYAIANSDYIQPFCASMQKDNFYATQFHPEKSGKIGEQILRNFINIENSNQ